MPNRRTIEELPVPATSHLDSLERIAAHWEESWTLEGVGLGRLSRWAPPRQAGEVPRSSAPSLRAVAGLDRCTNQRAVLGPGAVVVAHVRKAQQLMKDEPGVAGSFADAAVGND